MTAREQRFLRNLMGAMGLMPNTALAPVPREDVARELDSLPDVLRHRTMLLAIEAASVDGLIALMERDYLDAMAAHLGMSRPDVDHRLVTALLRGR